MSHLLLDLQHERVVCFILLCFYFALYRYAEMRNEVSKMFTVDGRRAPDQPTSSDDWAYFAFNEQLQRLAGQLAATMEGIDIGTLACTMVHIMLQVSSTAIST